MRYARLGLVATLCSISLVVPAVAQEWIEFVDRAERFGVNFPGTPVITEQPYTPQRGKTLTARIYAVQQAGRRYSMTVVNYADIAATDVRGAIAWEAWNIRKRGGQITYDAFAQVDRIEGHQLHITNPDKTMSFIGIYLHARRLYVLEATVPPDAAGGLHFQQSLMILDEQGRQIRYELDDDGNRAARVRERAVPR